MSPEISQMDIEEDKPAIVEKCFREIGISNEFEVEVTEMAEDRIHIFLGFPPRHLISNVVQWFREKSLREIFQRYPEAEKELLGGV